MSNPDFRANVALGPPVFLRTGPSQRLGYIVAVMTKGPTRARDDGRAGLDHD